MEQKHQLYIDRMNKIGLLKSILDDNTKSHPDHYRPRLELFNSFFGGHPSPVDIAVILYGALYGAHQMAYHLEGNNLLFFRPKATHKPPAKKQFLLGEPSIERTLLIFDSDMIRGQAMEEARKYFEKIGYQRQNIFGYLDLGCEWREYGKPELMHIDDLLKGKPQ